LSQDPIFLSLGNQNQLQQLSQQDQQTLLQNPQQLNSYSYAQDNPTTGEDPSGKYGEISGTVVIPGRSFSAGIRFDENGAHYFLGYGVGSGAEAGVEYAWAPGQDIPLQSQVEDLDLVKFSRIFITPSFTLVRPCLLMLQVNLATKTLC
jgi:hypothetical protein